MFWEIGFAKSVFSLSCTGFKVNYGLDIPTEWAQLSAKDQGEREIANSGLGNTTVEKMALK